MSDEGIEYYSGATGENANDWGDNDDLQTLMHAAADADARDNQEHQEALNKQQSDPVTNVASTAETRKTSVEELEDEKPAKSARLSGYYKSAESVKSPSKKYLNTRKRKEHTAVGHDNNAKYEDEPAVKYRIDDEKSERKEGHTTAVAAHYNTIEDKGLVERIPANTARLSGYYKSAESEKSPTQKYLNSRKRKEHTAVGHDSNEEDEDEPAVKYRKDGEKSERKEGHATVVAAHYNTLEDKGLVERLKSRIFYMRNFNNWIKSMLINEYLNKAKDGMKHNSPVRVMDMCCGKGGDLLKWRKGNISYLICTDIASVSLEQCESRYNEMCARNSRDRQPGKVYKAEFISADCTRVRLREQYADPSLKLDLVSCQFAFHYSFESLSQAECMLQNAAECLQTGGYFIGTMPDAYEIVSRQRRANDRTFGNDVYQITFQCDTKPPPLFGAKYNFNLEGVVDCPEFLVYFPMFVKLARKFGLKLVNVERFDDFFERMKSEGHSLMQRMQCWETYPASEGANQLSGTTSDYKHADDYIQKNNCKDTIGTLSKTEWEAATLYLTFAFQKVKTNWDKNGKPQYAFD